MTQIEPIEVKEFISELMEQIISHLHQLVLADKRKRIVRYLKT
ncbi:MAG TPA: hypothetical protein PK131_00625 [Candidatus Woesebacteria bacterium]|nr:hypothetical protein [Candidatus Woesebacteria bacterium]HRS22591.1 hypothetical protein [Candidatus Woesebacteria bacterium]HRT40260.1 hypothetical protein [Candidatus Woesebacteria bacterium]